MVLSGKDKGKKAKVLNVFPQEGKVTVDGINVVKRHTRPRPPKVPRGGILEKAQPIPSSNVMLICPKCNKPTRIAKKIYEGGRRQRICKRCQEEI